MLCFVMLLLPAVPHSRPMQTHIQETALLLDITQTSEALKAFRGKNQLLRSQVAAEPGILGSLINAVSGK